MEIIFQHVFVLTKEEACEDVRNARSSLHSIVFEQFVNGHVLFSVAIKPIYKRQLSFRRVALLPAFVSQLISRLLTMSTSSQGLIVLLST